MGLGTPGVRISSEGRISFVVNVRGGLGMGGCVSTNPYELLDAPLGIIMLLLHH